MLKSPKPPEQLVALQNWLAEAILRGEDTENLAAKHLTASNQMSQKDRFEVYVTDYRSRCLDSLRDDFEHLQEILGRDAFENLIDRYLLQFPSRSFTMYFLGQDLLSYVTREYHAQNRQLVLDDVAYEWSQMWANLAPVAPAFDFNLLSDSIKSNLTNTPLRLQPALSLLKLSHDVRDEKTLYGVLDDPLHLAIYRKNFKTLEKPLAAPFFALLLEFKKGSSLSAAIDQVCQHQNETDTEYLLAHATEWFQVMVAEQWLIQPSYSASKG